MRFAQYSIVIELSQAHEITCPLTPVAYNSASQKAKFMQCLYFDIPCKREKRTDLTADNPVAALH